MNYWFVLCLAAFVISFLLTKVVIWSLGRFIVDIPNERSSHSVPTPRGGGIAIVLAVAPVSWAAYCFGLISIDILVLVTLPILMSLLGLIDDFVNLAVIPRLLIQIVICFAAVCFCIQNLNQLEFWVLMACIVIILFTLVWLTNLYNFMDGINGLAALQAFSVCLIMAVLLHHSGLDISVVVLLVIVAFSVLGFVYWNFPVAKIFMGDVGSLFLGFLLGLFAVKTGLERLEIAIAWIIMLAVFVADASYTLIVRFCNRQKFYLPHRNHGYQKLAIKLGSHTKTTLLVLGVNFFWLLPLSLLVINGYINPFLGVLIAYTPIIGALIRIKAGLDDKESTEINRKN